MFIFTSLFHNNSELRKVERESTLNPDLKNKMSFPPFVILNDVTKKYSGQPLHMEFATVYSS
jgi:hypothetical protein